MRRPHWRSVSRPGRPPFPSGHRGPFTLRPPCPAPTYGTVVGFASADGRFLPLACTLNATVAIDRTCEWLELSHEDVAPSEGVVFLPWLGGERTPNAPTATGTMTGLRYQTDKRAILQAAYEGLVATLLEATAFLDQWAPQSMDAPLLLLGGGGRGQAWQETVGRLSGRPLLVVELSELVAYGAAVQASAVLSGRPPAEVARDWGNPARCVASPLSLVTTLSWRRWPLGASSSFPHFDVATKRRWFFRAVAALFERPVSRLGGTACQLRP